MIHIIFVCLGNICRSPLAQGVFEKKVREQGWESQIFIDSAGTSGWHKGEKPDRGSISAAAKNGIDITGQKSRPLSIHDEKSFHYFIAMDESNRQSILREFGVPEEKVFKMREFDPQQPGGDVPDPYGQGQNSFDSVYEMLERSVENFAQFLREKHPELP